MTNGSILAPPPPPPSDSTTPVPVYPTRPVDARQAFDQATLIVKGVNYQHWESVWVNLAWAREYSLFRFTAVEGSITTGFYDIQFLPGDKCMVTLGGVTVIMGHIDLRQVAYDATRHGVEIQGKSATAPVARSSVDTKTGSFDGMSFKEVAKQVLKDYPVGIKILGKLDDTPFAYLQNQPGERIWDFLERLARPRGIVLGSDSFGNVLLIGDHQNPVLNTQLIEGENIKKMQFVFSKVYAFQEFKTTAQSAASDDNHGPAASQLQATAPGSTPLKSKLITPAEQPVKSQQEVQARANNEALWHVGDEVRATVTVQGWFRDEANLWWPGDNVFVYSPMCPLNQIMTIESVTYTQDNANGTETTLELVQPWYLKDRGEINGGGPTQSNRSPYATNQIPGRSAILAGRSP